MRIHISGCCYIISSWRWIFLSITECAWNVLEFLLKFLVIHLSLDTFNEMCWNFYVEQLQVLVDKAFCIFCCNLWKQDVHEFTACMLNNFRSIDSSILDPSDPVNFESTRRTSASRQSRSWLLRINILPTTSYQEFRTLASENDTQ